MTPIGAHAWQLLALTLQPGTPGGATQFQRRDIYKAFQPHRASESAHAHMRMHTFGLPQKWPHGRKYTNITDTGYQGLRFLQRPQLGVH